MNMTDLIISCYLSPLYVFVLLGATVKSDYPSLTPRRFAEPSPLFGTCSANSCARKMSGPKPEAKTS